MVQDTHTHTHTHTPKPQVDEGLLFKAISNQSALLKNLGSYEHISTSQGCDPKGLVKILPLVRSLIDLEGTCEIHPSCLRKAIFSVLMEEPQLNDSKYAGSVWTNLKIERITVILSHVRRLAGSSSSGLKQCAARLSGAEYLQLQEVVQKVTKKVAAVSEALELPVEEAPLTKSGLKKEISDASLNSRGMPSCFDTPESQKEKSPLTEEVVSGSLTKGASSRPKALSKPSFPRRRLRQGALFLAERPVETRDNLKEQLALKKKKTPWRTYICGTTEKEGKLSLIVETTEKKHPMYKEILKEIKRRLEKDHLTKVEAIELRQSLYNSW